MSSTSSNDDSLVIMTDGSCLGNGGPNAVGGIGVHFPNCELRDYHGPLPEVSRFVSRQTSQRAEIVAASTALKMAKDAGYHDVILYTDSNYVLSAVKFWMHRWIRRGWRGKITNRRDFQNLSRIMRNVNVDIRKIDRVHNKVADDLANQGAVEARERQQMSAY